MKNIILFGGAFDPIHVGHLLMADAASKKFNAEVIFIPAKISVWKKESGASPLDKLEMIKLAIKDFDKEDSFFASDYEISLEKDFNYTIDTVKHFKEMYKNANLYLLIGQDQVNNFEKWKEAENLSKLAQIVYFARPGMSLNEENVKKFSMISIDGELCDASSTDIRNLKSLATTDSVINYIIDKDLYFMKEIKSRLISERYIHSKSVGKLSYEIAKSNNLKDSKKALIAGLIHDLGKNLTKEEELRIMEECYSEYLYLPRIIYHQFTGEYMAKKVFGIDDKVILDAIKYHTTANKDMTAVGMIVYCADKIEPTRGFDSKDLINDMKSSVIDGFKSVMKSNIEYYENHHINYLNPLTKSCLEQYYY